MLMIWMTQINKKLTNFCGKEPLDHLEFRKTRQRLKMEEKRGLPRRGIGGKPWGNSVSYILTEQSLSRKEKQILHNVTDLKEYMSVNIRTP